MSTAEESGSSPALSAEDSAWQPISLDRLTALITGGASGIGAASARLFAERGAHVVVADVAEEEGHSVVASLPGSGHRFVRLDVADQGDWEAKLPLVAPEGRLDIALFNAAIMTRPRGAPGYNDPLPWMTPERMAQLWGVNFYGVLWGMIACLPAVAEAKGTMLVTSSLGGLHPVAFDPAYSASKYALVGLAGSLAPNFQDRGVRVVTICPHSVDTPMQPIDVQEKKWAEGYSSAPEHMALSTLHIWQHGRAGEIWQGNAGKLPTLVGATSTYKAY